MQFTVVGAGALGTILGSHLIAAGHKVTLIARGERARYIATHGLTVSGLRELATPCTVVAPGAPVIDAGVVMFTVKTYQMQAALAALGGLEPTAVLSVANGVMKNEQLALAYGADKVLGCMANVSGELLESGAVLFTRNVRLAVGAGPVYRGPDPADIAAAVNAAGIVAVAAPDIETVEWSKFVGWLAMFTLSVVARTTTGVFLENTRLAALGARLVREGAAVAAARGIPLIDQSPIPVATVATASFAHAVDALRQIGRDLIAQAPSHRMSSLQDLEAGRPLEVHETLGHAVSEAGRLGVAAPTLALCYELAAGLNELPR